VRRFDLRSMRFGNESEAWRRLPVDVAPFVLGGLPYAVPGGVVDVDLRAARVGDRLTLTAGFETELDGPCQRCLEPARVKIVASGLDFVRHGDSETSDSDDEFEAYASAFSLDIERWVRDLLADALPVQLLCRDDCAGLCPMCGADLNVDPGHAHDGDGGPAASPSSGAP